MRGHSLLYLVAVLLFQSISAFSPGSRLRTRPVEAKTPMKSLNQALSKPHDETMAFFASKEPIKQDLGLGLVKSSGGAEERGNGLVSAMRVAVPLLVFGATALVAKSPALAGIDIESAKDVIGLSNDGGFLQSFLLIFISEIGDKTFFIAGLLAAKYGRLISFTGSIGALAVMTVISTVLGQLFHAVPPSLTQGVPYDDVIAVLAFTYFGLKTLIDSSQIEDNTNSGIEEEKADAEEAVEQLTQQEKRDSLVAKITQTFGLVFAAEIGDRSFLSTIALSAALNPYAVASGAIAAHASATGVAVAGGVFLSKYLSEKVIGYISAALFLVFAVTTALGIF